VTDRQLHLYRIIVTTVGAVLLAYIAWQSHRAAEDEDKIVIELQVLIEEGRHKEHHESP
jgi:threonine/homoserine/homoserine lactone efflux protein